MRLDGRRGYSMLEMLVAISIIGLLVSLALPALQLAREATRRNACQNNLRGQGTAMLHFEQSKGRLPSAGEGVDTNSNPPAVVFELQSFYLQTYSFLDEESYAAMGSASQYAYNDAACPPNQALAQRVLPQLLCPAQAFALTDPAGYGLTSYMPIAYTDLDPATGVMNPSCRKGGALRLGGLAAAGVKDGLSRTIAVAEDSGRGSEFSSPSMTSPYADPIFTNGTALVWNGSQQVTYQQWCSQNQLTSKGLPVGESATPTGHRVINRWAEPACAGGVSGQANSSVGGPVQPVDGNRTPIGGPPACLWTQTNCGPNEEIFSWHSTGANVLMCDGSVRFLGDTVNPRVLRMLITADDLDIYDDSAVP